MQPSHMTRRFRLRPIKRHWFWVIATTFIHQREKQPPKERGALLKHQEPLCWPKNDLFDHSESYKANFRHFRPSRFSQPADNDYAPI